MSALLRIVHRLRDAQQAPIFEAVLYSSPVSVNASYSVVRRGRGPGASAMLAPSKQLREFKVNALAELAAFPRPQIVPDAAYVLVLEWHMQYLETQKWVKTRKGGRWVRKDVSNLVKSIEDVVCTYLGTDDSANMVVIATKVATNDNPCIRAFVYLLEM